MRDVLNSGTRSLAVRSRLLSARSQCSNEEVNPLYNGLGQSPCDVSSQIMDLCSGAGPFSDDWSICACNTVAFNLYSACELCDNSTAPITFWSSFNAEFGCSSAAGPSQQLPTRFTVKGSDVDVPKWAYLPLTPDGNFDVDSAIRASQNHGWTTVQILTPIIVGVAVAVIALALFCCYRRRKKRDPVRPKTYQTDGHFWQDVRLNAPRFLFGLIPGTRTIRSRDSRKDSSWEIDDDALLYPIHSYSSSSDAPFSPDDNKRASGAKVDELLSVPEGSDTHGHSRGTSASSLFSRLEVPSFFSRLSLNQNAPRKSPSFKAVRVQQSRASAQFRMDSLSTVAPAQAEQNGERLAETDERSVLLISRSPGEDFTLDSTPSSAVNTHFPHDNHQVSSPTEA